MINKNKHVYCTNCKYGKKLINSILYNTNIPNECYDCCPYNPEDSMKYKDRPNYINNL